MNEKTPSLIINSIANPQIFDKKDQVIHLNKKKTLKPVEHPILLNNKGINEKTKESADLKLKNNKQRSLKREETIQLTKIQKISDSNANKSMSGILALDNNDNKEIKNFQTSKKIFEKKNSHQVNLFDLNSIKNIDLGEGMNINESFFDDNQEHDENKDNQNNPLMNLSDKNFNLMNVTSNSKWNFDKNLLDDSEFRKTHIIKEKLDIECIPDKPVNNINLKKIRSIKKSDNSVKISTPKKDKSDANNAIHKKVNSMIFIESKENETLRDLTNKMNQDLNLNSNNATENFSNLSVDIQEV